MTTYQLNNYYGIHYSIDTAGPIAELLSQCEKYAGIIGDDQEINIDGTKFCISGNTEDNDLVNYICIYIKKMTTYGPVVDDIHKVRMNYEPIELLKQSRKNIRGIHALTDMYDYIVDGLKTHYDYTSKDLIYELHLGWSQTLCVWNDEIESTPDASDNEKRNNTSESSSESSDESESSGYDTEVVTDTDSDIDLEADVTEDETDNTGKFLLWNHIQNHIQNIMTM